MIFNQLKMPFIAQGERVFLRLAFFYGKSDEFDLIGILYTSFDADESIGKGMERK